MSPTGIVRFCPLFIPRNCEYLHTLQRDKDRLQVLSASHLWVSSWTNTSANTSSTGLTPTYPWSNMVSFSLNWTSACLPDNIWLSWIAQHSYNHPFTLLFQSWSQVSTSFLKYCRHCHSSFISAFKPLVSFTPTTPDFWKVTKKLLWDILSPVTLFQLSSPHNPITSASPLCPWQMCLLPLLSIHSTAEKTLLTAHHFGCLPLSLPFSPHFHRTNLFL